MACGGQPAAPSVPTPTVIALPAPELPPGWRAYTSENVGFSIYLPADWIVSEQNLTTSLGNPTYTASKGAQGAGMVVTVSPQLEAEMNAPQIWEAIKSQMVDNQLGEPIATTLGGEPAMRGALDNPQRGIHGNMTVAVRGTNYFLVVTYSLLDPSSLASSAIFDQMISSFRFTK